MHGLEKLVLVFIVFLKKKVTNSFAFKSLFAKESCNKKRKSDGGAVYRSLIYVSCLRSFWTTLVLKFKYFYLTRWICTYGNFKLT